MKQVRDNILWMFAGALTLCLLATLQKIIIGAALVVHGYIVPVLFGGISGLILGAYTRTMKRSRELLRRTNAALDQRVRERTAALERALAEIKTLQGILPICSHCKQIRDNDGHWHPIDEYICEHSDVDFSHSICPECLEHHYPEYKHP
jgi:hypothetical protein